MPMVYSRFVRKTKQTEKRSRFFRQVLIGVLVFLLFPAVFPKRTAAWAADFPSVSADGYCVIDAVSGELIVGSREQDAFAPASITKIMTALVAAEQCQDPDESVVVSEQAVTALEPLSSTITPMARAGEKFTVRDLLYGLIMKSGNECANILAEYTAGSTENFAQLMNARAQQAGALHTHFANAHGLDDDEHYTTPYDMALIMKAALENPLVSQLLSDRYYTIPATNCAGERAMQSGHSMLNGGYTCNGVFAGKTGYTIHAKWTLVTAAERDGRKLIAVVMKCDEGCSYSDTDVLLQFAFARAEGQTPQGGALVYDPQVSEYSASGFTVTWAVGPDAAAADVPVWIEYDSTDQMTRDTVPIEADTADASGRKYIRYHVDLARHGGRTGVYTVQAYVYDVQGAQKISTIKVLAGPDQMSYGLVSWNGAWYYIKENGALALDWTETEQGCYRFDYITGQMQTGWFKDGQTVYYLDADGKLASGWREIDGNRYYFQVPGDMAVGRMQIEGFVYEFGSDGVLQQLGLWPQIAEAVFSNIR